MPDTAHAILSASASERWMVCPGSINLISTVPKLPTSPAAEEGTAAHEAAAVCLQEGLSPLELAGRMFNNYEVTEEMVEALDLYVNFIAETIERLSDATLYVEKRFDLSWVRPNMFGTNDAAVSQTLGELVVVDLKYGKGIVVEVVDNTQLLYYALGALNDLKDDPETVTMVIVQPRAYHEDGPIRKWSVPAQYVRDWAKTLGEAADRTQVPGALLKSGDHCRFCDAAGICPELGKFVRDQAESDFTDLSAEVLEATPDTVSEAVSKDLSRSLTAVPVVKAWCKSVEDSALMFLQSGEVVEGFKLVRGRANRQWKDEKRTVRVMRSMKVTKAQYLTEPKLISPAQAEKLPNVTKAIVDSLAESPDGRITVAPAADPRIEIAPSAESDFAEIDIFT